MLYCHKVHFGDRDNAINNIFVSPIGYVLRMTTGLLRIKLTLPLIQLGFSVPWLMMNCIQGTNVLHMIKFKGVQLLINIYYF